MLTMAARSWCRWRRRWFVPDGGWARALPAAALLFGVAADGLTQETTDTAAATTETTAETETTPPTPFARELARVRNLVRANVLELAQEILETQGPPPTQPPTPEWLRWERQLWTVHRVRGRWQALYERTSGLPPGLPPDIRREAQLQAIGALTALQRGREARALIRRQLADSDAPPTHKRQLREAVIAAYLADDLLADARIALDHFHRDYGASQTEQSLLSAGVRLQSGDPDAAVNLLAPLDQPSARLLRIYARLLNRTLTPAQALVRARALASAPERKLAPRDLHAVLAQAHLAAGAQPETLALALEDYLLAPPSRTPQLSRAYPRFAVADLFAGYAASARDQANRAGLLIGEEWRWFEHALKLPQLQAVARRALFAHLAATTADAALRRRALDALVNNLVDSERTALIARLFGDDSPLGALVLGGETGLRLSAYALGKGDFELAAEANANLLEFPAGVNRNDWLLQAGRIDIFAGRHRRGAARLGEWLDAFDAADAVSTSTTPVAPIALTPAQADAILQPIFDLQTVGRHQLALELLHQVAARAPGGKYPREIAYWLAESYAGSGQYVAAADLFLHSALAKEEGFDRWGESARFRAAEALLEAGLYADAGQLLRDLLARATSDARRSALRQKLQRVWLLQSTAPADAAGDADDAQ